MIRKPALAERAAPPPLGVPTSRYFPGLSAWPAMRPVKRKPFAPSAPATEKPPRTGTCRVHLRALRFLWVALTQAPPFALRPDWGLVTVKRTLAAWLRV